MRPLSSSTTPEPKPRRGQAPHGGPYGRCAVLTFTVLAPARSTASMYRFCKSANMTGTKASARYVERVARGVVTGGVREGTRGGRAPPKDLERREERVEEDADERAKEGDEDGDGTDGRPTRIRHRAMRMRSSGFVEGISRAALEWTAIASPQRFALGRRAAPPKA